MSQMQGNELRQIINKDINRKRKSVIAGKGYWDNIMDDDDDDDMMFDEIKPPYELEYESWLKEKFPFNAPQNTCT